MYSITKESKYKAVFLLINNKTQCVPFLCLSSRFMTYAPSCILGKLSPEQTPLNLVSSFKYLVILILLKGLSRTKNFDPIDLYYYILCVL